jgi:hypothetical protein
MGPFALIFFILLAQTSPVPRRHPTPAVPQIAPRAAAPDDFTLLPPPEPEAPPTPPERPRTVARQESTVPSHMGFYIRFWCVLVLLVVSFYVFGPILRRRREVSSRSDTGRLQRIDLSDSAPALTSPWDWIVQLFGPHAGNEIPIVPPEAIKALATPADSDDVALVPSTMTQDEIVLDAAARKDLREKQRYEVYIQGARALARRMIGPHTLRCVEVPKGPPELRWRTWLDAPTWEQAQVRANGLTQGAAWRKLIRSYEREGGRWIDHAVETHGGPQTMEASAGIDHSLDGKPSAPPRAIESKPPPRDLSATKELLRTG